LFPLELSESGEDTESELALSGRRVNGYPLAGEDPEPHLASVEIMNNVD